MIWSSSGTAPTQYIVLVDRIEPQHTVEKLLMGNDMVWT